MKKEEIREKHLHKNGLSVNNSEVGKKIQKSAFDAMEEYAKQEAIAFYKWFQESDYHPRHNPEELYPLYTQTKDQ